MGRRNATIVEDAQRLLDLQEQAETLNREIAEIKTRIRAAKTGNDQPAEKTEA